MQVWKYLYTSMKVFVYKHGSICIQAWKYLYTSMKVFVYKYESIGIQVFVSSVVDA